MADVGLDGEALAAESADFARRLFQSCIFAADQNAVSARVGAGEGHLAAQAAAAAGDEEALSREAELVEDGHRIAIADCGLQICH
jgi:hypothetical protein